MIYNFLVWFPKKQRRKILQQTHSHTKNFFEAYFMIIICCSNNNNREKKENLGKFFSFLIILTVKLRQHEHIFCTHISRLLCKVKEKRIIKTIY